MIEARWATPGFPDCRTWLRLRVPSGNRMIARWLCHQLGLGPVQRCKVRARPVERMDAVSSEQEPHHRVRKELFLGHEQW